MINNQFFTTKKEIQNWLCEMDITAQVVISVDLKVNVFGVVDLNGKNLTHLPVQFGVVKGHFDCSYNQLKNLDKGPLLIDGSLWCEHNPLSYWDIQSFPQVKEVMIMSSCGLDYLDSYIKQEHGYVELPGSEIKELLRNAFLKQQLEEELKNNENSRSTHKI